jgi:thiosulfate/3-mercaptopyruvate sulfurtransferase
VKSFVRPVGQEVAMSIAVVIQFRRLAAAAALALGLAMPASANDAMPLVSTQWLKSNLSDPAIVVLDIRSAIDGGGAEAFAKAHIPGAVHSDYDKGGWRVTRNGVPFMLPTTAELEKLIGESGIDEDNHVVIVPAGVHATDFGSAARVYWTLKVMGHPRVSILDGGFAAWAADAANPIETGVNRASPKIFTATPDKRALAEVSEVEAIEKSGGATLIDGRPARFFAGKDKAPASKAYGHIPRAINLDSATFYDPTTNRLRPPAELAAIAIALPAGPVVSYCNTGHWASTNWFVLSEVLGQPNVKLYPESMVGWSRAGLPMTNVPGRLQQFWIQLKEAAAAM